MGLKASGLRTVSPFFAAETQVRREQASWVSASSALRDANRRTFRSTHDQDRWWW